MSSVPTATIDPSLYNPAGVLITIQWSSDDLISACVRLFQEPLLQQVPVKLIQLLNLIPPLLIPNLQVKFEGQRTSNDIARPGLGIRPLWLPVWASVRPHRECP